MKKILNILKIEKKSDFYCKFFFLCYLFFSLYLCVINFYNPNNMQFCGMLIAGLLLFSAYMFMKNCNIKINKIIIIVLLVFPLIIRLCLLFLNYGNFVDDYNYLLNSSLNFASEISLDSNYISMFPYIYPFIFLIGNVFKLLGTNYFNFILVNLLFELMGAFFLFLIIKNKKGKIVALKALLFYLYNPFSILWITKCCPVIVVNTLLIISIYFFSKINLQEKKYLLFSLLTGLFMGITNSFRPILIIFLIAIFIYYVYLIIKKENIKKVILSFLLILSSFVVTNRLILLKIGDDLDTNIKTSQSGFTLLVGSNMESHGTWNISDSLLFSELVEKYGVINGANEAKKIAFERYKSYGVDTIKLLFYKSGVMGTNLDNYSFYDVFNSIENDFSMKFESRVELYTSIYWYLILFVNLICAFLFVFTKVEINSLNVNSIFGMGLFVAMLFVEVSARYFIPILVPLFISCSFVFTDVSKKDI